MGGQLRQCVYIENSHVFLMYPQCDHHNHVCVNLCSERETTGTLLIISSCIYKRERKMTDVIY